MITGDIPNIIDCIDVSTIHVHAPSKVVLVCGGKYDAKDHDGDKKIPPRSLRDAYLRFAFHSPFSRYFSIMPDEVVFSPPKGPYDELLEFEADLAQLSELVILFTESPGSLAELGAFSMVPEIAPRLLVIIDNKSYTEDSFIRLGPVYSLRKRHGNPSVFVLNLADINLDKIGDAKKVDIEAFRLAMESPFKKRIEEISASTRFNRGTNGHIAKLATGLIQHYGALTKDEIVQMMSGLGVELDDLLIDKLLFCAETVGWIKSEDRGFNKYYASSAEKIAINFDLKTGIEQMPRTKWRAQIREYWKASDTDRFKTIAAAIGGVAP